MDEIDFKLTSKEARKAIERHDTEAAFKLIMTLIDALNERITELQGEEPEEEEEDE